MSIQSVGGFRITSKEPIDDRLVVTSSNGRFAFDAVRYHDGLTVFTTSSKQYHILVNSSSYNTDTGWRQIFIDQSSGSFNLTGSINILSGSIAVSNGSFTGDLTGTASWATNVISASHGVTASYVNTLNQDVTINGTTSTTDLTVTSNTTVSGNATITGNLTVNGTTTYINVQDLLVEDKFILLNSGSLTNTPNEGGIIVQTTSSEGVAYGTALYYDQEANRWVVNRSGSVAWNATSSVLSVQSDFIVTVTGSAGAPTGTPVNFGTTNYFYGQMYIQTDTSDIYIYA
jgi:hypothetical protein